MRRVHKYADGGKVVKSETDAEYGKKVKRGNKKKDSKLTEYSGMSVRERQMKELGLADGGKVKMKPPMKGGKPKRITTKNPPGGSETPGAKGTYPKPKKMACGGKVKK